MEVKDLVAECELNPDRLPAYLAELLRLREFARYSAQFRGRLPLKVRDCFERNVPPRAQAVEWARAVSTGLCDEPTPPQHQPAQERLF